MISNGTWPGDALLLWEGRLEAKPSANEIASNFFVLKPLVMKNPCKALGGYQNPLQRFEMV